MTYKKSLDRELVDGSGLERTSNHSLKRACKGIERIRPFILVAHREIDGAELRNLDNKVHRKRCRGLEEKALFSSPVLTRQTKKK